MTNPTVDLAIAKIITPLFPVWEKLDRAAKKELLAQGKLIDLSTEEFICMEGDVCNHLPLIISGRVRVYKTGTNGREITLYHLEQGDSCIMTASCIISQQLFPAFAVAETEVRALTIPASSLKEWVKHNSIWQEYIFGLLARRIAGIMEIVEAVAFERLDCRIATYLIDRAEVNSQTIKTTHEAIAQELGSSREVISRILKTWSKQGLISLFRGKIELKNISELKMIALPKE